MSWGCSEQREYLEDVVGVMLDALQETLASGTIDREVVGRAIDEGHTALSEVSTDA